MNTTSENSHFSLAGACPNIQSISKICNEFFASFSLDADCLAFEGRRLELNRSNKIWFMAIRDLVGPERYPRISFEGKFATRRKLLSLFAKQQRPWRTVGPALLCFGFSTSFLVWPQGASDYAPPTKTLAEFCYHWSLLTQKSERLWLAGLVPEWKPRRGCRLRPSSTSERSLSLTQAPAFSH